MYTIIYPNIIELQDETIKDITPFQPGGDDVAPKYAAITIDGKRIEFYGKPIRSREYAEKQLQTAIDFQNDPRFKRHLVVAVCPICGQEIKAGDGFEDAGNVYRHEWC